MTEYIFQDESTKTVHQFSCTDDINDFIREWSVNNDLKQTSILHIYNNTVIKYKWKNSTKHYIEFNTDDHRYFIVELDKYVSKVYIFEEGTRAITHSDDFNALKNYINTHRQTIDFPESSIIMTLDNHIIKYRWCSLLDNLIKFETSDGYIEFTLQEHISESKSKKYCLYGPSFFRQFDNQNELDKFVRLNQDLNFMKFSIGCYCNNKYIKFEYVSLIDTLLTFKNSDNESLCFELNKLPSKPDQKLHKYILIKDNNGQICDWDQLLIELKTIKLWNAMEKIQIIDTIDTNTLDKYIYCKKDGNYFHSNNTGDRLEICEHLECTLKIMIVYAKDPTKPFELTIDELYEEKHFIEENEFDQMSGYRRHTIYDNNFSHRPYKNYLVAKLFVVKNNCIINEIKARDTCGEYYKGHFQREISSGYYYEISKLIAKYNKLVDTFSNMESSEFYPIFEDYSKQSKTMGIMFEHYFEMNLTTNQMIDIIMKHIELDAAVSLVKKN